jgi:hypothetical protein
MNRAQQEATPAALVRLTNAASQAQGSAHTSSITRPSASISPRTRQRLGARQAERLSSNEGDRGTYDHRPADREWLNITMPPRDRGGVSPWVRGALRQD